MNIRALRQIGLPIAILAAANFPARAQAPRTEVYKRVANDSLLVYVFAPADSLNDRPAVVLFHGGGLVWGEPGWTFESARRYLEAGFVAFAVQYRLADRKTVTPIDQIEDAEDAIRWVRGRAVELGINGTRIVAHGVSAGGYLSAMAAGSSDLTARPNALVLWSPGVGRVDDADFQALLLGRGAGRDWSALSRIHAAMPPTFIVSGAADSVTFDASAKRYCARVIESQGRCEVQSYPERGHLLTRNLSARAQRTGQFDWDLEASADAESRSFAFLAVLGYGRGGR